MDHFFTGVSALLWSWYVNIYDRYEIFYDICTNWCVRYIVLEIFIHMLLYKHEQDWTACTIVSVRLIEHKHLAWCLQVSDLPSHKVVWEILPKLRSLVVIELSQPGVLACFEILLKASCFMFIINIKHAFTTFLKIVVAPWKIALTWQCVGC